jgi:hypothetical protein
MSEDIHGVLHEGLEVEGDGVQLPALADGPSDIAERKPKLQR